MSEHTHTYTHEHDHSHDGHDHDHEHTHTYTHDHADGDKPHTHEDHPHEGHEHHHHHDHPTPENKEQVMKLLDYMYKHNSSHEDELSKMADKLTEQGYEAQAQKVSEAKELFAKGNAALKEALEGLK